MNTIWSDNIQGIMTLYLSRKLRFDDMFRGQYETLFRIDAKAPVRILDIGCGPGALAGSLARWYPQARITGIDRDHNFISFASEKVPQAMFTEGDASALPFADESFDVTVSYTVAEHIDPEVFWREQLRVLKPQGICLCMSVRKGIRRKASCLEMTHQEKDFWDRQPDGMEELQKYGVGRYRSSESELPALMEKYGFRDVTTGYAIIDLTPDDPKYPEQMALAMINAERQGDLEAIRSINDPDDKKVIEAVNAKYDRRIELYKAGNRQWDTDVSVTQVLRGIK